uniref:Retroviral polymerase SH3-like domain-containing protein n=1 Tax=Fagus sylvatica TaxID=28930 RepID=A0A2N9HMT1_FAGSY
MLELHKRNLLKGVKTCKLGFCKYCVYEKQPRISFKIGSHTSKGVLDYVHSHVWGLVSVSSHSGAHYFVSFIDDYSRKNEVAERMNKTLAKMARSIRLNTGLSKVFWAEAINTASFIINISPTADNDFNIPQESGERTKLDPKSRKCIFLGFEKGVKGYRLWDPDLKEKAQRRNQQLRWSLMRIIYLVIRIMMRTTHNSKKSLIQLLEVEGSEFTKHHKDMALKIWFSFALITSSGVPLSYKDATNKKYSDKWLVAMSEEMESL